MSVFDGCRHVSLEVVAPRSFYCDHHDKKDFFVRMNKSLNQFAGSKINALSMSLNALAFPDDFPDKFDQMFKDGNDVETKCNTDQLTDEGQAVHDAFNNLTPAWP